MKQDFIWERDGYTIRLAHALDAEPYYEENFNPLDPEVSYLTGCKEIFSRDEVLSCFHKFLNDSQRYFFLIIAPDGRIAGESVINEINLNLRCANFRIGIFHETERGKGIGTWAVETARDFAFEELNLHRLELEVYSFNPRAEKTYRKAGFQKEGILRDAVLDKGRYADIILMSILEEDWRNLKGLPFTGRDDGASPG